MTQNPYSVFIAVLHLEVTMCLFYLL